MSNFQTALHAILGLSEPEFVLEFRRARSVSYDRGLELGQTLTPSFKDAAVYTLDEAEVRLAYMKKHRPSLYHYGVIAPRWSKGCE